MGRCPPAAVRGRKDSSLEPSEGARPSRHLDFRHLASRTVRKSVSVALSHPVCDDVSRQPREARTMLLEAATIFQAGRYHRTVPLRNTFLGARMQLGGSGCSVCLKHLRQVTTGPLQALIPSRRTLDTSACRAT